MNNRQRKKRPQSGNFVRRKRNYTNRIIQQIGGFVKG